jgi:hypothetical protein
MAFLLDADVLIDAKRKHYGFDFCPGFWDWLVRAHAAGAVSSVEMVGAELMGGTDELADWARARGPAFFAPPDASLASSLAKVSAWVSGAPLRYEPTAISAFLRAADYFLIAQALGGGHTIVTNEAIEHTPKRVKIPNVCLGLGIKWVQPHQMLRHEGARFVLGA